MLKLKLFILMVLQLFIWGAWLPVIFGYLGNPPLSFNETQQSWVLNAFAIGSFAAMFFSTPFADRMFPAEKFLAASHLVGGGSILALTWDHRAFDGAYAASFLHAVRTNLETRDWDPELA